MPERDFPIGHPAASDYNGEPYVPPSAYRLVDYPPGHPAHAGANSGQLDTPDGMREAQTKARPALADLAKQECLPPVLDPTTGKPLPLAPEALAVVYAAKTGADSAPEHAVLVQKALEALRGVGLGQGLEVEAFDNYCKVPSPAPGA